jgi:outer membrane protein OmpA-like peptidoglycan-associated protein
MRRFPASITSRRTLLFATLFSTVGASQALAQGNEERQEDKGTAPAQRAENPEYLFDFGLVGGGHFFNKEHVLGLNQEPASPKNSGMFGAILGLHFNRWIGLEAEAWGIPTHLRGDSSRAWVFAYRGSFVLNMSDNYVFQPFVLAGYGGMTSLVSASQTTTTDPNTGDPITVQSDVSNRTWGFVHAGLGFKIGITPNVGIRLDGRILAPWTAILPLSGYASAKGPDFEAFGGFYVNFSEIERIHIYSVTSKRVDTDGDGIPDDVDKCPTEAEDKDGYHDDDGCPDPDNDNDGIPDTLDKCPNDPEDKDGFEDQDGCPDLDNDHDGIPDALDKCPNEPEDKDGFEDQDGCPDPDNDRDGIPDTIDKCPNEPETVNKYKDEDGCPDEVPAEVKKFTGVIEGINFKTGSAEILPGSFAILDRALKVLQDYPDVNLEISGHTDSKGSASVNLRLSQHRADSVKLYFVSRGVASSRLLSVGYGKERPIADNSTASGRATNRRTEFRLISPGEK